MDKIKMSQNENKAEIAEARLLLLLTTKRVPALKRGYSIVPRLATRVVNENFDYYALFNYVKNVLTGNKSWKMIICDDIRSIYVRLK